MAESFDKRLDRFEQMLQETHDTVIRLETRWNGGPGDWPQCKANRGDVDDHEKRLRNIETRFWFAAGGLAILGPTLTLAAQHLLK